MGNRGWKTSELKILKANYPTGGMKTVARMIDRSPAAIHKMAMRNGIGGPLPHVARNITVSKEQ